MCGLKYVMRMQVNVVRRGPKAAMESSRTEVTVVVKSGTAKAGEHFEDPGEVTLIFPRFSEANVEAANLKRVRLEDVNLTLKEMSAFACNMSCHIVRALSICWSALKRCVARSAESGSRIMSKSSGPGVR